MAPHADHTPAPLARHDPKAPLLALWRGASDPPKRLAATASRWIRAESEDGYCALQTLDPATGRRIDSHEDPDPLATLEREWRASRERPTAAGGWLARLYYRLGAWIEPTAGPTPSGPLFEMFRIENPMPFEASTPGRSHAGAMVSNPGAETFRIGVERVLEYLRAGDIFQVNLAHELRGAFVGDPREAFATLAETTRPLFGAMIQSIRPTHPSLQPRIETTLSMSPELFLDYDANTGLVSTRPMKGTRPLDAPGAEDDLAAAAKDHAELAMIIDLMRNDLGRVCTPGTIRVVHDRAIERHAEGAPGAILQATATVEGRLADKRGLADLLTATFPPGSVTGAPKVRAMQIIDELEPFPRDLYCGATAWLGDDGKAELAVAIRTASVRGRPTDPDRPFGAIEDAEIVYPVGAGIVADSDPQAEWEETLVKAGILRALGAELPR